MIGDHENELEEELKRLTEYNVRLLLLMAYTYPLFHRNTLPNT